MGIWSSEPTIHFFSGLSPVVSVLCPKLAGYSSWYLTAAEESRILPQPLLGYFMLLFLINSRSSFAFLFFFLNIITQLAQFIVTVALIFFSAVLLLVWYSSFWFCAFEDFF